MTLGDWLYRYGWSVADAETAQAAFDAEPCPEFKARAAARTVKSCDDSKHDYSGEMLDCVVGWLFDQLPSREITEACEA